MNGGSDIPGAPQQTVIPPNATIKYSRWFRVDCDDAGGFLVTETRDESEIVCTGSDGSQISERQRRVMRIADSRVDVHAHLDEWCNRFSDVAVAGLREADDHERESN